MKHLIAPRKQNNFKEIGGFEKVLSSKNNNNFPFLLSLIKKEL
jgi:hypothetical protein